MNGSSLSQKLHNLNNPPSFIRADELEVGLSYIVTKVNQLNTTYGVRIAADLAFPGNFVRRLILPQRYHTLLDDIPHINEKISQGKSATIVYKGKLANSSDIKFELEQ